MSPSVYTLNKSINKPIEFKGLKAQYIWYLGAGLLVLLILFAVLYIGGVSPYACLGVILLMGTGLFACVHHLSHTYGAYGMMKATAKKAIPKSIYIHSRKTFIKLLR